MKNNFIENFLSLKNYEENRLDRRKQVLGAASKNDTAEFFTPYSIVKRMCDKISDDYWSDPEKTFCEPCFGNGQFVVYIIWNRLQHGIDWKTALETCYGVELMQDNVYETHGRIIKLFDALDIRTSVFILKLFKFLQPTKAFPANTLTFLQLNFDKFD